MGSARYDGAELVVLDLSNVGFVDLQGLRTACRLAPLEAPAVLIVPGRAIERIRAAAAAVVGARQPRGRA